jgi:hypothetical protein
LTRVGKRCNKSCQEKILTFIGARLSQTRFTMQPFPSKVLTDGRKFLNQYPHLNINLKL